MIKKQMLDEFNEQIKLEMESAYLYLAMAAWFDGRSLNGMGAWMKAQATEEMEHAMRFYDHILDRDGKVVFEPLGIKKTEWDSPINAFEDALEHERFITSRINHLLGVAQEHKDQAAHNFLEWFVNEQIEEEATASKICDDLKLVGDSGYGVLMLDRELGQRTASPASGEKGA